MAPGTDDQRAGLNLAVALLPLREADLAIPVFARSFPWLRGSADGYGETYGASHLYLLQTSWSCGNATS